MTILVIEDDPIWLSKTEELLHEINLTDIYSCTQISEVEYYLTHNNIDFIIADVLFGTNLVFDLLPTKAIQGIPILYVTSSEEMAHYQIAKSNPDSLYLIKPLHPITLRAAIDKLYKPVSGKINKVKHGITVRGIYNEKIFLHADSIQYIKSDWNYCKIKTPKNQFVLKASISSLLTQLGAKFIRIHRTYIINTDHIQKINLNKKEIRIANQTLPIGRSYKDNIEKYLSTTREI